MSTSLSASKTPLTPSSIRGENTSISGTERPESKTHYLDGTPVSLVQKIPIKHEDLSTVQRGIERFTRKEGGYLKDIYPDTKTNEIVTNPFHKKLVSKDKPLTLVNIYPDSSLSAENGHEEGLQPPLQQAASDAHTLGDIYPDNDQSIPNAPDNLAESLPPTTLPEHPTVADLYHNPNDRDKNPQGVSQASNNQITDQWNPLNEGVKLNMGDRYPAHHDTIPIETNPENTRNASYWKEVPDAPNTES